MAHEAGLYDLIWRAEENGITQAKQLIAPLEKGIALMRQEPERFKKHDPKNGWGSYGDFVPWLENLLEGCRKFPEAEVTVSR
jgi:hypothetical protein